MLHDNNKINIDRYANFMLIRANEVLYNRLFFDLQQIASQTNKKRRETVFIQFPSLL